MRAPAAPRRRRWWPSLVAAGLAFAILIGLGTWQVERLAWKEGLIAILSQRLAAQPTDLPPPQAWGSLDPATHEFQRVRVRVTFPRPEQALVYTVGSALRPDVKGPGHWVMALGQVPGGQILVNRGFLPQQSPGAGTPPPPPSGPVELVAVLRWPESRGRFTPKDDPGRNLWFSRDPAAIAAGKGWGPVAPFYLEQEAPAASGGQPQTGPIRANLPNNHLQYALTWYSLAVVFLVVFTLFFLRMRRSRNVKSDSA
jgi:surfeit locus 1 family protein